VREAEPATVEQIERVHSPNLVAAVAALCAAGGGAIDADTFAGPRSYEAALRAAGAAVEATERILAGETRFAFCGLRPPGHHAETERAMGFCLFNNVAIGAAHAIAACGAERVMIVDWDVHHGNGTQEVFYDSAEVLFASIHQSPLYPGGGDPAETGTGAGLGYTINLPVPPGSGGDRYIPLIEDVLMPRAMEFRPDLLAISAGYDAHRDDPLADCMLDEEAFGEMAALIAATAGELGIGVLVTLEGGYSPPALAASVSATIAALSAAEPR